MLRWSIKPLRGATFRLLIDLGSAYGDDIVAGRIRADQINNIKRYLSLMMVANACNAAVLVVALWASPQRLPAMLWAATVILCAAYFAFRQRHSSRSKPLYVSARALTRSARNALILGSVWAALPLLFFADASPGGQVIIACLCAGMLGGGSFALASVPAAAVAFTAPIVFASAIAIGRSGDAAYLLVALLMVSYITVLWRGVFVNATQIAKRVAEQVQAEREIRRDALTALPNRLAFFEGLARAFERHFHLQEQFAILYVDLDDFKVVNDCHGHATGDKLLIEVGQRLKDCVRDTDLVARLGGDEFAVILAKITDVSAATALAERVVGGLDVPFLIDGAMVSASACIGVAIAPADGTNPEHLLKSADDALYDAKHRSGGVIQLYDADYKDASRRRRSLERDIRIALRREEFFLVYQPIFALEGNRIEGCEALLRWRHPTFGVRLPIDFMDIMEDTGLINEIGHWIFREACNVAASLPEKMRVAVNVSAVQLRRADILPSVLNALTASTLAPHRLEIEITETAVLADSDQVLSNLRALRELGVRIALDDFGTGYSSLTYLRKLSPDSIKIDASFVRELGTDAGCASIVKSLITLSKDLGIKVVAEGIETGEQLNFLRCLGCDEGQGNLIGVPMSRNELAGVPLGKDAPRINAA